MNLTQRMQDHHKHCDDLFAEAEAFAQNQDWSACGTSLTDFDTALRGHFGTEEDDLFPAFEAATGMTGGPTQMMRYEHTQMRGLLGQMADALSGRDADQFAGAAETLLVLMQQHNMKEENILYPMCENALAPGAVDLEESLRRHTGSAHPE